MRNKETDNQKKRNCKGYAALLLSAVLLLGICQVTACGKQEEPAPETTKTEEKAGVEVSFAIDSSAVDEAEFDVNYKTTLQMKTGDTAFDALEKGLEEAEITYTGDSSYVTGIGGLEAGAYGEMSGWMYDVNGKAATVGCGDYDLQDGDSLEWRYVLEF